MEDIKEYFGYSQEEKESLINKMVDNFFQESNFVKEELNLTQDSMWKFYKKNFNIRKETALKQENYEMCDIIDKVIEKIEKKNAYTRQKTRREKR